MGNSAAVSHLCGLLLMQALGTKMTSVGYKGGGPAMTDLLGGQVDMTCDQTTNTTGHIRSGKVKAYAVTTKARLPSLPDLPTLDEAGLKGFEGKRCLAAIGAYARANARDQLTIRWAMKPSSQPAYLRLPFRLAFRELSARAKFRVTVG